MVSNGLYIVRPRLTGMVDQPKLPDDMSPVQHPAAVVRSVVRRWYAAYPLSLRNREEMMVERGMLVDTRPSIAGH